jgi:hypothetical protein
VKQMWIDPGYMVTAPRPATYAPDMAQRIFIPKTKRYPGEGNRLARRTAAAKRKGGGK